MTFAASVKEELCSVPIERECCAAAECYGFLLFSKRVSVSGIIFQTEYKNVAKRYRELLRAVCGVSALLISPDRRGGSHMISIPAASSVRVLDRFGHTGRELSLRLNRANLSRNAAAPPFCAAPFSRAAPCPTPRGTIIWNSSCLAASWRRICACCCGKWSFPLKRPIVEARRWPIARRANTSRIC